MNKKSVLSLFVVIAALTGSFAERPNVLFIAVDDLRPELFSFGSEHSVTPNIDALCKQGVRFDRAYCMVPTCGASRAALMTSIRPARDRFHSYQSFASKDAPDALPLHTLFKNEGYHTVSYGKIFHQVTDHADGWSEPPVRGSKLGTYKTDEANNNRKKDLKGRMRGPATESADVEDHLYGDGELAGLATEKLAELAKSDTPFFFALGFYKPHLPFVAPKKYWDMYDEKTVKMPSNYFPPKDAPPESIHTSGELRTYSTIPREGIIPEPIALDLIHGYHACVSYTDAQIGKVLAQLDALGLRENTIVVLWGDHGWNLGEHTLWCKHSCYETSLRAPLVIAAPSVAGAKVNAVATGLTEFIDIYPTLCDLTGIAIPGHVEGASLLPVLKRPKAKHKEYAVSRFGGGDTIRSDRYRYSVYRDKKGAVTGRMLYDHVADPDENVNVAVNPENGPLVKQLERELMDRMGKPY